MASFEFNPLSDCVTVTYQCPRCGHKNKETFQVPTPDLTAETHRESINQDFADAQCENCEEKFNVVLTNGIFGGDGEIKGVEVVNYVEDHIDGEDDDYFDKLLFEDTHSDTEKALDALEKLPHDIRDNLYRLLYANIISKLEAFLCDTIISYVLSSDVHKRQFVQNYEPLATQKFQMSAIYNRYESLDKIIRDALTNIIFHNIKLVRKLYKSAAGIDLPDTKSIEDAIKIRHDIVHRNGKDKEGNLHIINRADVEILSDHVMDFIYDVDCLVGKKADIMVQCAELTRD